MRPNQARRRLIKQLGATAIVALAPKRLSAELESSEALYVSAYKDRQNRFGVAIISDQGNIVQSHRLPSRGHGSAINHRYRQVVSFARRPGNFALAIDCSGAQDPVLFETPDHSHFYGHGVFSADGKLLYASENKFSEGIGIIGVYASSDQFRRVGELSTHGVGPHQVILMPDGITLCIANGGILTHPDSGRAKLNLHDMQSSVAFIDSRTGQLRAKFTIPEHLHRLSLRHMDVAADGRVWLGGQYEGDSRDQVPLIANISSAAGLQFPAIPQDALLSLSNYIGSVACHPSSGHIAFSSPKGNNALIIDSQAQVIAQKSIEKVCGVSPHKDDFLYTSMTGLFGNTQHQHYWDNHIMAVLATA